MEADYLIAPFDRQVITQKGNQSKVEFGKPSPTIAKNSRVYAVDCRNHTANEEINATLQSKPNGGQSLNYVNPVAVQEPGRPMLVRRLTPRECERLQGLPDDWTLIGVNGRRQSDTRRYMQIGNAVAVPVAEWIARRIVAIEGMNK